MGKPPDKDVIAFCGDMKFICPLQVLIIQGRWNVMEINKF